MSQRLQEAYEAFMAKAPGAAFQRARALYINKYPLPQNDEDHGLRLYVWNEQLDERVEAGGGRRAKNCARQHAGYRLARQTDVANRAGSIDPTKAAAIRSEQRAFSP